VPVTFCLALTCENETEFKGVAENSQRFLNAFYNEPSGWRFEH
jgi:hypothetical protein